MNLVPYIANRLNGHTSDLADLMGWNSPGQSAGRYHEDKDNYYAEFDLPGVRKEAVQLNVEGEELTLAAEREIGFGENRRTVSITRGLALPEDVNAEAIRADFQDGVLRLTFPKREESKPKQLKIAVN
ncbi:MAG: Hsp20/alpha crystallin family protein [Verrucomicrobium sp.]|nr:Hsp20/alpha crystallin family protein [Verrucomicrobium sp.]